MKTSYWKVIIFILLMVVLTIMVFPYPKRMVVFYKDTGMITEARDVLSRLLSKKPDNTELLDLSAELYHLYGDPIMAIKTLRLVLENDPINEDLLVKLATYHQWNDDPMGALPVWEKITEINPKNIQAQIRLIDYYRYYGFPEIEGQVVANLIKQEQKAFNKKITLKEERVLNNPLVKELTRKLNNLSETRLSAKYDPVFDSLITGMYIIKKQYMEDIQNKKRVDIDHQNTVINNCFELYIKANRIEMGYAFASRLDEVWNHGFNYRLKLIDVMRWFDMDAEALVMLQKINQEYPNNNQILSLIVKTSLGKDDVKTAITICEKLVKANPDNMYYKKQLAPLYLRVEQPLNAYHLYKILAKGTKDNIEYINMMIVAAGFTRDKNIMSEAAQIMGELMPEDMNMAKKQVEIFLAADYPERAYYVLRQIVMLSGAKNKEVYKMLEVAGFTGKEEIIRETIAKATELRPYDTQISLKIAELYLGIGDEKDSINAYAHYLKLNPKDVNAQKQLAKLYLWTNQQTKAADIMLAIANANPGDKNALVEAAKYSEEAGLIEQAFKLYEKIYNNYPGDMSIQGDLIRLASWTNKWDYVAPLLGKISDSDPENFKRAFDAGNAFVEMNDLKKGITYLERALTLNSENVNLRRNLAKYYGWVGYTDKKITELEYLDSLGLLDKEEMIHLAQAYLDRNNGTKALKYLKHYEKEETLQRKEGLMLATAFELSEKNELAIRIYKRLAKENIEDADFLARLGNRALWINQSEIALIFFKTALKKDTTNLLALKKSAQIYANQNNPEKAIKLYTYYNRLKPDDYEAHFQLGELFFANERNTEAFKEYKKSLKLIRKLKRYAKNNFSSRIAQSTRQ